MPAEWERHAATWLAWPHFREDWPGKFDPIPWVYAESIRHLSRHERVELLVNDASAEAKARKTLDRAGVPLTNIRFHRWKTDRVWTRDSGCIFVRGKKSKVQALHFRFNAWAKYPNFARDARVGANMARTARAEIVQPVFGKQRVVLEGGSIDVNGQGTLLTTEECLLSKVQERNLGRNREEYETMFATYFDARKVIWLGSGIAGDDTHGHVDDLARFVAPHTIVTVTETNRADPNYEQNKLNHRRTVRLSDFVETVLAGGPSNDYYLTANNEILRQPGFAPLLDDIGALPEICNRVKRELMVQ